MFDAKIDPIDPIGHSYSVQTRISNDVIMVNVDNVLRTLLNVNMNEWCATVS